MDSLELTGVCRSSTVLSRDSALGYWSALDHREPRKIGGCDSSEPDPRINLEQCLSVAGGGGNWGASLQFAWRRIRSHAGRRAEFGSTTIAVFSRRIWQRRIAWRRGGERQSIGGEPNRVRGTNSAAEEISEQRNSGERECCCSGIRRADGDCDAGDCPADEPGADSEPPSESGNFPNDPECGRNHRKCSSGTCLARFCSERAGQFVVPGARR